MGQKHWVWTCPLKTKPMVAHQLIGEVDRKDEHSESESNLNV